MRHRALALLLSSGIALAPVAPAEVTATDPQSVSVTVYRSPSRSQGRIDLARLAGFALVSEVRTVRLPAGESTLRFEGVADGIEPSTAIVAGLPGDVLEKNRDGASLTPATLLRSSVGERLTLVRQDAKHGRLDYVDGIVRAAGDSSAVFETAQGIEVLGCSGVSERFDYHEPNGLTARPTLSVRVRSAADSEATVTLSYLSRGFDWAADYVAQLAPDGRSISLGGWVTLANSNGTGFASAAVQVVAGRLNRQTAEVEPMAQPARIVAECWPRGSTSDPPFHPDRDSASRMILMQGEFAEIDVSAKRMLAVAAMAPAPAAAGALVQQEDLGDLKLYRVPAQTTLSSRQSKQVRLLDRSGIPVQVVYGIDAAADSPWPLRPARRLLRTRNDTAHHLGLALPSGQVATFLDDQESRILLGEAAVRDTAVNEELEIAVGDSPDVQVSSAVESLHNDGEVPVRTPVPRVLGFLSEIRVANRVEVTSARRAATKFELRLSLNADDHIVGADRPFVMRNGRYVFELLVPPTGRAVVRYQTQRTRYLSVAR